MSFDVDKYVRDLLEEYRDDEHKWIRIAACLQYELKKVHWIIDYSQRKLEELEELVSA